ncbi:MAG: cytochrome c peroxidase [Crocinitomix sp.]|jgi:cytochrome c peroxidase
MKKLYICFALLTVVLIGTACNDDDKATPATVEHDKTPYMLEFGDFPDPNIAADNQLTVQGVQLGRMLFYEKMLSKDGSMACASCHLQEFAFSDTAKFSIGVEGKPGGRHAMAVFNMAWNSNEFFWDGRAHLIRDQSLGPIQDELEMNETLENVITKLSNSVTYNDQFVRAFGSDEITSEKMSLAMEQFMNSIVSYQSLYDNFLEDTMAFNASQKRGRDLFFGEYNEFFPEQSGADCAHCHGGANFENDKYANNGLDDDASFKDGGREKVTKNAKDKAKFKITSLRNVELTAPYMHDGRFNSLEEVVNHYNKGLKSSSTLDPALDQTRATGLRLTEQDKKDLVNFLKTLTDTELTKDPKFGSPF